MGGPFILSENEIIATKTGNIPEKEGASLYNLKDVFRI